MPHDPDKMDEKEMHAHTAGAGLADEGIEDADLGGTANRPAGPDFGADDRTPPGMGTDFGDDPLAGVGPLEPNLTDPDLAFDDTERDR